MRRPLDFAGIRCTLTVACDSAMNWIVVANIRPRHHGHRARITNIDWMNSQ